MRERMHAASQLIYDNTGHLSTVMSITFYASSSGRFRQTCTLANFDFGDILFWRSFILFSKENVTFKDARVFLWKYV